MSLGLGAALLTHTLEKEVDIVYRGSLHPSQNTFHV